MDTSDPALLDEISSLLAHNRKNIWIDVHKLRAWKSGRYVHVDFHLILPRDMPLEEGHGEVKELEKLFDAHFGSLADVLIHLDPCTDPECPVCWFDPCETRREGSTEQRHWRRDELTADAPTKTNSQSKK
jgi:divalent metal cation (Fe/Co/Zn/Cd) transporter